MSRILLRYASPDDAPFLARCVLTALHIDGDHPAGSERDLSLVRACQRNDTLYSYGRSRVVTVDGTPVGASVCYPGSDYRALRSVTFPLLSLPEDGGQGSDDEAVPGEWYLDTVAVLPAFRGCGLGRMLVLDAVTWGERQGYARFSLLCRSDDGGLREFYKTLGFAANGKRHLFGQMYDRLVLRPGDSASRR